MVSNMQQGNRLELYMNMYLKTDKTFPAVQ